MQKRLRMKRLIKEELWKNDEKKPLSIEEKKQCIEAIRSYGTFGKQLNSESNLVEVAKKLSELAENATQVALSETEDWFDKNTINRNMNELKTHAKNFQKVATDAQRLQERMQAMYEDMGHILGRYYDLDDSEIKPQPATDGKNTDVPPEIDVKTQQPPIKESVSTVNQQKLLQWWVKLSDEDKRNILTNYLKKSQSLVNVKFKDWPADAYQRLVRHYEYHK